MGGGVSYLSHINARGAQDRYFSPSANQDPTRAPTLHTDFYFKEGYCTIYKYGGTTGKTQQFGCMHNAALSKSASRGSGRQ